jgi:hypothetical protein
MVYIASIFVQLNVSPFTPRIAMHSFLPILILIALGLAPGAHAQRAPLNPAHTIGVESCRDCHSSILESWEASRHASSFSQLAQTPAAKTIAKNIGIHTDAITTHISCVRCHFTQESLAGSVQTTAAVSCESCHGSASEWIDIHNSKSLSLTQRVAQATGLGMHHPANLHDTVKTCFECHVIDDEQLVNRGGHPALSPGFELLSWYSGEVRHNYLISSPDKPLKSTSKTPQSMPQSRQHLFFLTGKLLHLAHSLTAIARSQDAPVDSSGKLILLPSGLPTYAVQHAQNVQQLWQDLEQIHKQLPLPAFNQTLAILRSLPLSTGHQEEIATAANQIARIAKHFSETTDPASLPDLRLPPPFQGRTTSHSPHATSLAGPLKE